MKTYLTAFALAILAFTAAAQQSNRAALAAARTAWRSAGLADYEYSYQKYCECHRDSPPETIVTVRAGAVVGVRHKMEGSTADVPAPRNLEYYWTIDGLLDLVDSALRGGAATVRASYDAQRGYPTQVYVDYDADFIGDELDVRVTSISPLAR
jgi:hypothetical protein